jgi:hypothetical protein
MENYDVIVNYNDVINFNNTSYDVAPGFLKVHFIIITCCYITILLNIVISKN